MPQYEVSLFGETRIVVLDEEEAAEFGEPIIRPINDPPRADSGHAPPWPDYIDRPERYRGR